MRILYEALGWGEADNLGGSGRVAQVNARALAARGHQVTFLCTNRRDRRTALYPDTTERITAEEVRVVYLRTTTLPWWPGEFGPHYVHGVAARLRAELAVHDILHLHEYRSHLGAAAARQAARAGVPYVLHPQGTLRPGERSRFLKYVYDRWVGRRLLDGASRIIAGTEREREQIAKAGIPEDRLVVVPNGIDVARFQRLPERGRFRDRHGIPRDAPVVLCVGRLEPNKGQDVLVRSFCEMDVREARLVLIGPDSGLGPRLRRMASACGRQDAVLVTGPLPDDREVVEALVDADVYVQPSRSEAFGMAILEACAASLPLVLSDGCQNAPAFRDRAALVVPCESAAMVDALRRLLEDTALRSRFGAAGRGILEREYALPAVVARLEQVYSEALAEK